MWRGVDLAAVCGVNASGGDVAGRGGLLGKRVEGAFERLHANRVHVGGQRAIRCSETTVVDGSGREESGELQTRGDLM